ncbi:hypothetical protein FS749_014217 [Ceratobasidium sp. UAMH 11750]|nr:hypothetical protein FS749_014217 [Ceratobasidium sp. UAMH 11750]
MKAKWKAETVEDQDKLAFLDALVRKIDAMCNRAKEQAGIFFEGNIGVVSEGLLRLQRVSTKLGKKFLNSPEGIASVKIVEGWLGKTIGKAPANGDPPQAVIPVREEHMHPKIPDMHNDQPTLQLARSWLRTEWSGIYQLHGGAGNIPYKEITEAISRGDYSWIPEDCIPEGVRFDESGQLSLEHTLIWLRYLADWKLGSESFGFSQVYTVDAETLPTVNQASSREVVTRNGAKVWLAQYDTPVTEPQNVRPIYYPQPSWVYLYFLEDGRTSADPALGPDHWAGLPSRPEPDTPCQGPIGAEEFALVKNIFANADEDVRSSVTKLMTAVNTMETKVPVWTEDGLWDKATNPFHTMPRVLPFYKPVNLTGLSYWQDPWLELPYFQRPRPGMDTFRLDTWEMWQSDRQTSGPSFHAKSGTHVGGPEGIVWLVRGNIKVLANAGALVPDSGIEMPIPLPGDYDKRRLGPGDFARALDWVKEWIDGIHTSIAILDATHQERWQPAGCPSQDPRIWAPAIVGRRGRPRRRCLG